MSSTLRVLHVIPSLGPLRGGPSFMARAMAEGLAAAGLSVDVVATDDNGPERLPMLDGRILIEGGVGYRFFPRQTRFYTGSAPLGAWLAANVGRYNLVHAHALFSFAPLAAAAAAAARGVPYILRPLGVLSPYGMGRKAAAKQLSFQLLDRHALAAAAAVHFTSEQERREAALLGVAHRPVVVPLPVALPVADLTPFRGRLRAAHPALAKRVVALFLSRIDPKKGLELLLPAVAAVRARGHDLALVVAGDGAPTYLDELRTSAAGLGLDNTAVVWAGFLSGEAKLAALADADLFVLPSYAENFAVAAVEAMAAGLPVIVSDQVGVHDEIGAAGAGLVTSCAVPPLTEALAHLAADPRQRAAMGAAGRLLAAERFAPGPVITRLLALYEAVCAGALAPAQI